MKKLLSLLLSSVVFLMTGCSLFTSQKSAISEYDYSELRLVQFEELYMGQPVAVVNTSMGVIKIALYPEYAPNTVGNFIDLIKKGFYDGKSVAYIPEGAFFLSGVPDYGTDDTENSDTSGSGSDSGDSDGGRTGDYKKYDIKTVENEYSVCLWPFKGALCSTGEAEGESDSRFFVINGGEVDDDYLERLKSVKKDGGQMLPDELLMAFREVGGMVTFSGFVTVYGQTVEGMDVVEKICGFAVDEYSVPYEDIIIEKIEIEYHGVYTAVVD